ncbi:hypothetical protein Plec18170_003734 [Paecilomyces lecythidis]
MERIRRIWPQLFPSSPPLAEANVPDQTGKVIIVTGSTSGIGYELVRILYQAGGTVYMASRNEAKAEIAIKRITEAVNKAVQKKKVTTKPGIIKFLQVDFSDLKNIKPFVEAFLSSETRLDLLYNNAGVANVPSSERTAQGFEVHMGTNVVAPYVLTRLLSPILISTVQDPATQPNSVRVVWSSSMLVDVLVPPEGVPPQELENPNKDRDHNYAVSKAANWFLAVRFAKLLGPKGVISLAQNPGNILSPIFDGVPRVTFWLSKPVLLKPVEGAYTMLWAGLSPDITVEDGGRYVIPRGRWHPKPRDDLLNAIKDKEEDGLGLAQILEEWCEMKTRQFR